MNEDINNSNLQDRDYHMNIRPERRTLNPQMNNRLTLNRSNAKNSNKKNVMRMTMLIEGKNIRSEPRIT